MFSEVADGRENVLVERSVLRVGIARAFGSPVAAEVEGEHSEFCCYERLGLFRPAILIELAAMSQYHCSHSFSVNVGIHQSPVFGGKRDGGLCRGSRYQQKGRADDEQLAHAANLSCAAEFFRFFPQALLA